MIGKFGIALILLETCEKSPLKFHLRSSWSGVTSPSSAVRHAPECKLRVPPLEFPVVQLGVQVDVFARVFRHVQAVVHCIRGAGRYQPNINNGAARPRIALVDGIAVRINL